MTAVPCGQCGSAVRPEVAEHCWFCGGPLCGDCWEAIGHCGHAEAFRLNRELVEQMMQN